MTRTTIALVTLVVLVAFSAVSPPLLAQRDSGDRTTYRVRAGDTLELIAAEYYGDRNDAIFIMVDNRMQHGRKLQAGERLKIPMPREITTSPDDTLGSLAKTYLGDARRAPFLADFNRLSLGDNDPIAVGTQLSIPFHVTHVAAATETVASIAAAYFGDARQGDMLRRYNFLERPSIDKGESLVVPIFHVRVRPSKLPPIDAESQQRRQHKEQAAAMVAAAMPRARSAWDRGEFDVVWTALDPVARELDYVDTADAIQIGLLLGKAYAALDKRELALDMFRRVHKRAPQLALSRYYDSPKIVELWEKAEGRVE